MCRIGETRLARLGRGKCRLSTLRAIRLGFRHKKEKVAKCRNQRRRPRSWQPAFLTAWYAIMKAGLSAVTLTPGQSLRRMLLLAGYADTQRGPQRRTLPGPYWFFSNSAAGRARFRQFSERAVAGTERQPAWPGAAALTTKRVVGTARSTAEPTPGIAQGTGRHLVGMPCDQAFPTMHIQLAQLDPHCCIDDTDPSVVVLKAITENSDV